MSKKIITPTAILSYPWLDRPQAPQDANGVAKYSAVFIFEAGTDLAAVKAAITEAATEKWGAAGPAKLGKSLKTPLKSTDAEGKDGYPPGSHFLSARAAEQPGMVYNFAEPGTGKPALVPTNKIKDVFYPGSRVRASITAFAYDKGVNKGVGFALNNIQWLGDGERLDSRVAAENEFDADLTAAPADLADALGEA